VCGGATFVKYFYHLKTISEGKKKYRKLNLENFIDLNPRCVKDGRNMQF